MLFIDHKYTQLLSNRLQRFTKLNPKTYNFRCPICGDSQKNNYKSRGYIYEKKDHLLYFCHNCGASMLFGNFLKQFDQQLFNEYSQEKYLNKEKKEDIVDITKIQIPKFRIYSPLKDLKKISQLEPDHPAKRYVTNRKIPAKYHYKLCYCPRFKRWINTVIPGKFNGDDGDEARLIIPFIDKDDNCFGVQGRSFKPDGIRYITIIFDESKPKIFGLDTVDLNKPVHVLEGPIDSMFIENSVAMAGSDLSSNLLDGFKGGVTFVYDNEPRNKQIVTRMEKCIDKGYNIVIWPESLDVKDINEMVMEGIDPMTLIKNNTYSGLGAKMKITQWKKT